MRKLVKYCVLFLFLIIPYGNVFAYTGTTLGAQSKKTGNNISSSLGEYAYSSPLTGTDNANYTCQYNMGIRTSSSININALDMYGNNLIPNSLNFRNALLAGTALKLNIFEYREVSYEISVKVIHKKEVTTSVTTYSCEYDPSSGSRSSAVCTHITNANINNQQNLINQCNARKNCKLSASTSYSSATREETVTSGEQYEECKKIARSAAKNSLSGYLSNDSYTVSVTDSNDISSFLYGFFKTKVEPNNPCTNSENDSCTANSKITFYIENVCMDLTTGMVNYSNDAACQNNEVKIEDYSLSSGEKYFHYFIPMNALSSHVSDSGVLESDFTINLTKDTIYSAEDCLYTMEKSPDDYKNFLTPLDQDKTFSGDYGKYSDKDKSNDKKLVGNRGCKSKVTVNVPILQSFFVEKSSDNKPKISNFGVYFRTIDINNPFPQGINNSNSLWKEWSLASENGKKPKIKDSFKVKTYDVSNINLSKIREYNKNNSYFSWKNINAKGYSEIVSEYATRTSEMNFYPLGYGPLFEPSETNSNSIKLDSLMIK